MRLLRFASVFSFAFLCCCSNASSSLVDQTGLGAYFNRDNSSTYADPYRGGGRRVGKDFEQMMIDFVEEAQTEILVAVQEFRLPRLAKALVRKKQAGIPVKIVVENSYNYAIKDIDFSRSESEHVDSRNQEYFAFVDMNNSGALSNYEISERDAMYILRSGGIPIIDDTEDGSVGSGLMHHKFIVVDHKQVLISSANFTPSDTSGDVLKPTSLGNANAAVVVDNVQAAQIFETEFDIMWGDGPGLTRNSRFGTAKPHRGPQVVVANDFKLTVQFSAGGRSIPWNETSNGLISQTIAHSKRSINAALFVFTEQWISDQMYSQHEQHQVDVKMVKEPLFAYRYYSKALDMWGLEMPDENCRYNTRNNPWVRPLDRNVGVASLETGDMLHHKFAVVDDEVVIFGSHNWSNASNYTNDETLVVIEGRGVARKFKQEFDQLYQHADLGAPHWLVQRVHEKEVECGR